MAGHMTGKEYRESLQKLGLNITTGARFLHIDVTSSRRRANDRAEIGWETACLLRLLVKYPELLQGSAPTVQLTKRGS